MTTRFDRRWTLGRRAAAAAAGLAALALAMAVSLGAQVAPAVPQEPYEPTVGQGGKDVVWVPTPPALVEKMLDMAGVGPGDVVMDLGSGDGRNIIAAAKRGARSIGVEYNPDMVVLSSRLAREAGVEGRATFVEGDMFTADVSGATVLALFLLPDNLERLRDTFLNLRPGTRMALNTFGIPEWDPDETAHIEGDCASWCTALLYYVPARVEGVWTTSRGELRLSQAYQVVTGTLAGNGGHTPVNGRLRGTALTLDAGGTTLTGTVAGDRIEGAGWSATRAAP